jgi:hypothetical protein
MFLTFSAGEIVYAQGREDNYANYLLEGSVEFLWNGRFVRHLDAEQSDQTRFGRPRRKTLHGQSENLVAGTADRANGSRAQIAPGGSRSRNVGPGRY